MRNLAEGRVALRTHSSTRVRRGKRTLTSTSHLLDAIRRDSPCNRCLSGVLRRDVWIPGRRRSYRRRKTSPLNPQSPYAAAKAAAHLLCLSDRESYGLRVACGILFNHQSRRRGAPFLSRKVIDHVETLRHGSAEPLRVAQGTAGLGVCSRLCGGDHQSPSSKNRFRCVRDVSSEYRDYVLGTGDMYCVRQFIDRAFFLAGFEPDWDLHGENPALLAT